MPFPLRGPGLALAVALLAPACDGATAGAPPEPASAAIVAGDGQAGPVAAPLSVPPSLRVLDRAGAGVPDVVVTWSVEEGGGSVEPATTTTAADGTATTAWTLGPAAGTHSLSARVEGLPPVLFRATGHPGPVASLSLEPRQLVLAALGDTVTVTPRAADRFDNPVPAASLAWRSSDTTRVAVDGTGRVAARGPGSAFVHATAAEIRDSVRVSVVQEATGVRIVPGEATLRSLGATLRLRATATDRGGSPVADAAIAWSSLDPAVVAVDASGEAAALSPGTARVVAAHRALADTAEVLVRQAVAAVEVTPASLSVAEGRSRTLTALPVDSLGSAVPDAVVAWTSSDPDVAEVDAEGRVRGVGAGRATITATAAGVSGSARVTVSEPDGVGGGGGGEPAAVVGPAGGEVTVGGGAVTLAVPAGAVGAPVTITAVVEAAPPGLGLIGSVLDLGPDGLVFAVEVEIRVRYDAADLPPGATPADLRIVRLAGGALEPVTTLGADLAGSFVRGRLEGFSQYGLILASTVPVDVGLGQRSVTVTPQEAEIAVGESLQFAATVTGGGCAPQWASSNPAVARIDPVSGLATGLVAGGQVRIVASCGGTAASATLTVR